MSSILRALRKLEDEKATMGEGGVDLAHDILKRNYAQRSNLPWLMIFICCGLLLVTGGVGAWFYWSAPDLPPNSSQTDLSQVEVERPSEPRELRPESVPALKQSSIAADESITVKPVQAAARMVAQPESGGERKLNLPAKVEIAASVDTFVANQPKVTQPIPARRAENVTLPPAATVEPVAIPQLRVDAIVFHQQADARLAVVNDLPVMEGTDIEGARVEEILVDRVRFSFKGIRFNKFPPLTKN